MLQSNPSSAEPSRPSSPHKRIAQSGLRSGSGSRVPSDAEFVGSAPIPPQTQHGISSSAFSPNYFKTFFVEERELGRGGKGVVLLVRHALDGVPLGHFACKRVPVGDDHEWLEKVLVEVQLLQNLSHQNLVSYRHVWLEEYQVTTFGPSVPCAFILQQYCNAGDLHHYLLDPARSKTTTSQLKERLRRRSKGQLEPVDDLHGPRRMPFDEIFSFFKDITSGLNHLHTNGYIHRDLKPSNCLLHKSGSKTRVLVSDFGEVQVVDMARKSTGATGTISYCAPEVVRKDNPGGAFGNFSTKSDIFSLGMIVYFMCFGRLPYKNADDLNEENEDLERLRAEISAWVGFEDERRVRADLPDKLYKFLKRLLSLAPEERPGTEEILQGIKGGYNLDDAGSFASSASSLLPDMGSRISRVDSPAPPSHKPTPLIRKSSNTGFSRSGQGPSRLRETSGQEPQSPSPPYQTTQTSSGTPPRLNSSMTLRRQPSEKSQRKEKFMSEPHSPRLMLPPPHPTPASLLQRRLNHPLTSYVLRLSFSHTPIATLFLQRLPNSWISELT